MQLSFSFDFTRRYFFLPVSAFLAYKISYVIIFIYLYIKDYFNLSLSYNLKGSRYLLVSLYLALATASRYTLFVYLLRPATYLLLRCFRWRMEDSSKADSEYRISIHDRDSRDCQRRWNWSAYPLHALHYIRFELLPCSTHCVVNASWRAVGNLLLTSTCLHRWFLHNGMIMMIVESRVV